VRVFKMKSKKHYHRTRGFRASQTQLKVVSISS
jgi:ribosomal protein L21